MPSLSETNDVEFLSLLLLVTSLMVESAKVHDARVPLYIVTLGGGAFLSILTSGGPSG